MKYVTLKPMSQSEILSVVCNKEAPIERRSNAMLTAIRWSDPDWAVELLITMMVANEHKVARTGFSLVDMAIQFGKLSPDLDIFYKWAQRYLSNFPNDKKFIDDTFDLIPGSKWNTITKV